MASINDKDSDHYETLLCVKSACRTAVEILNDLLCFDKLESGILEMHRHEVPVIPFIADCVNMFASQAREAGVTIKNTTSQGRLPPGMDTNMSDSSSISALPSVMMDIIDGDIVFMDKFKMDQVLRNLISNAVKFTPRGGSVTVCASFIPNQTSGDDCSLLVGPSAALRESWAPLSSLLSYFTDPAYHFKWLVRRNSQVHVNENGTANDLEMGLHNLHRTSPHDDKPEGVSSDVRNRHDGPGLSDISNNSAPRGAVADDHTPNIAGKLRIVVTDTGAGISVANQQRLFKEIVQFDPEVLQAGGGSGLGLWISNSIVQMHSGTLRAYSGGPNKGSTFTTEIDMLRRVPSSKPVKVLSHGSPSQTSLRCETLGDMVARNYSKAPEDVENSTDEYDHAPHCDSEKRRLR